MISSSTEGLTTALCLSSYCAKLWATTATCLVTLHSFIDSVLEILQLPKSSTLVICM